MKRLSAVKFGLLNLFLVPALLAKGDMVLIEVKADHNARFRGERQVGHRPGGLEKRRRRRTAGWT